MVVSNWNSAPWIMVKPSSAVLYSLSDKRDLLLVGLRGFFSRFYCAVC